MTAILVVSVSMENVHACLVSRERLAASERHSVQTSALDMEPVRLVAASVTHHGLARAVRFTVLQSARTTVQMLVSATMVNVFVSLV